MAFQFGAPNYGYNPQQTFFPQQQYTPPQQMQPQQMTPAFACHPVTSREEAVAAQTDYFSAGLVMPDLSHSMVYLKRFNQQTGASDFYEFQLMTQAKEEKQEVQYVTVEEFQKFQKELSRRFCGKIEKEVIEEYE